MRDPLGHPGEAADPKAQPFTPPLFVLTGDPRRYHRPRGRRPIGEGVAGALALAALTQGARATLFATHGTGKAGRLLLLLPVVNHIAPTEAALQLQHAPASRARLTLLAQTAPHVHGRGVGQDEGHGARQAPLAIEDVGTGKAQEVGRPLRRTTAARVGAQAGTLALAGCIRFIERHRHGMLMQRARQARRPGTVQVRCVLAPGARLHNAA